MTKVIVFEDSEFANLLPLVYWRATCQLRCGRLTLVEKICVLPGYENPALFVRPKLADIAKEQTGLEVNPSLELSHDEVLLINGRWLADRPLPKLPNNSCLCRGQTLVAARLSADRATRISADRLLEKDCFALFDGCQRIWADDSLKLIDYPWDLVQRNSGELIRECADASKLSPLDPAIHIVSPENVHIGESTKIKPGVVIDAEEGPVWIDDHVTISPNAVLQGPCCIGPGSLIQTSAIVRENTSIGPVCKIGGEIEASIIHGYSNKQHYGFFGHSYVGEWVNIGAGATNSDLKNTYGTIKVSLDGRDEIETGLIFVGLTLGDHTKVGINVCFPTGAVVGTVSSVIVSHYPPKFVPSFCWLTDSGQSTYDPEQAIRVAERSMARRRVKLTEAQKRLFRDLPGITRRYESATAYENG
jgi:UDP-N-acetylglucosamine diphosphorylase/glucosamine-1-phosphate N-acetyltransferase